MSFAKDYRAAVDPSRSYWQRWTSPFALGTVDILLATFARDGIDLNATAILQRVDLPGDVPDCDAVTTAIVMHARCRTRRAGLPLFVLDEACAVALAETDLPDETIGELRLPHEGFYIAIPPTIGTISDPTTGDHVVEGIHVCEDHAFVKSRNRVESAVSIVAIGRAKGYRPTSQTWGLPEADDSIRHVTFAADAEINQITREEIDRKILRIALNLVWALEGKYLTAERVTPKAPKSPGKLKVLARRGFGLHPYTILRLSRKAESARGPAYPTGRHVSAHIVRGHWRSYWTLTPADAPTYGAKFRDDGKKLDRIRHWIPPFVRGEGDVKPQTYKVTK